MNSQFSGRSTYKTTVALYCIVTIFLIHSVTSVPLEAEENDDPAPTPHMGTKPSHLRAAAEPTTMPINQQEGPEDGHDTPPGVTDKDADQSESKDQQPAKDTNEADQSDDKHDEKDHPAETEHDDNKHDDNKHDDNKHDDDKHDDDKHDDDKHDDDKHDDDDKEHKGDDDHKHKWGYHGQFEPTNWWQIDVKCSPEQSRQSPIDIITNKSQFLPTLTSTALLRAEDEPPKSVGVVNNGHSVVFKLPFSLRVSGGDLGGSFQAAQLHFHWGEDSTAGSEHTIDNMSFPLELHIVTYNEEKYDTLMDAVFGDNSLAVLGVLFQISEEDNPALEPLVSMLDKVRVPGVEVSMPSIDVEKLLPLNTMEYYRYEGSLTTPPCAQSVIWTVFRHTVNVSEKQLSEFRELLEDDPQKSTQGAKVSKLAKNFRPPQPLHTRLIYRSFPLPLNTVDRLPYERAIALRLSSSAQQSKESASIHGPESKPAIKASSRGSGAPRGANKDHSVITTLVASIALIFHYVLSL